MEESKGNRKEPHLSTLRRHWELVLLNLSCAVFQRRWQLYAKDDRTQKKLDAYATNDWKTRTLAHVVDHLKENGLIHVREGALYKGGALVTRISPTDALAPQLYQFFLDTEQPIQPPYTAALHSHKQSK